MQGILGDESIVDFPGVGEGVCIAIGRIGAEFFGFSVQEGKKSVGRYQGSKGRRGIF